MLILENDRAEKCYIDGAFCSGARFLFCDDCRKAMKYQKDEIKDAKTPLERSYAHILHKSEGK